MLRMLCTLCSRCAGWQVSVLCCAVIVIVILTFGTFFHCEMSSELLLLELFLRRASELRAFGLSVDIGSAALLPVRWCCAVLIV